jgi:transcriptional regulator with XRE-family HTH domain
MDISSYVRYRVAEGHTTQTVLADALGIHRSEVSRRLAGKANWQLRDLVRLAEVFGMPLDKLVRAILDFETFSEKIGA